MKISRNKIQNDHRGSAVMLPLFVCMLLCACGTSEPALTEKKDPAPGAAAAVPRSEETLPSIGNLTCDDLQNKKAAYVFAFEEVNGFAPDELDTANMFLVKGHFTRTDEEQTLVYIPYHPNGSCGTCCHLLMIFSCEENARVIFSEQEGGFSRESIRDLNGDGLLDIETDCGTTWMGESHQRYSILTFAGGKMTELYANDSYTYLKAGFGDESVKLQKKGDTIGADYNSQLRDPDGDGVYEVLEVRSFHLFNGGKTEDEAEKRMIKTQPDTNIFPLRN